MQAQWRLQRLRQHHHPILAPLALANDDGAVIGVHALDPQRQTLGQPDAGAKGGPGKQAMLTLHQPKHPRQLVLGQDDLQPGPPATEVAEGMASAVRKLSR